MSASLADLTVAALREKLRSKEVSPVEALDAIETRIAERDPALHAYLSRDYATARAAAEKADISLPLGGIPVAIKDNMNALGEPCTCASKILQGYRAPYDATAVARLKAAGAIPFGRTNMDEFAMGSSTENSAFGPTRNPWALSRVPGGSSGGSAAAVAGGMAYAALGSDTGGSIRQPAALCGVVGLKPTYGRVSRFGLVAFASSLDQIGPFALTVEDAALLLNAIAGHDPHDSTSLPDAVPDFTDGLEAGVDGLRIGLPKEYFVEGIDPAVERAVREAVDRYAALGAEIEEISLPNTRYVVAVYYLVATAEASANLARFDGVRYGYRAADATGLLDMYGRTRAEGFGPEVKRRIILGTYALSSGYYDAYYQRANLVRELVKGDYARAFQSVDVILCPTSPEPAFPIGDRSDDPLKMYLADICTIAANLAGIPAISVPCGFAETPDGRLPLGLQLMAPRMDEVTLLRAAHAFERSAGWYRERPPAP